MASRATLTSPIDYAAIASNLEAKLTLLPGHSQQDW